jgi:hypothetical protein
MSTARLAPSSSASALSWPSREPLMFASRALSSHHHSSALALFGLLLCRRRQRRRDMGPAKGWKPDRFFGFLVSAKSHHIAPIATYILGPASEAQASPYTRVMSGGDLCENISYLGMYFFLLSLSKSAQGPVASSTRRRGSRLRL